MTNHSEVAKRGESETILFTPFITVTKLDASMVLKGNTKAKHTHACMDEWSQGNLKM